jgi:ABC-type phosphate/phosphonate transport system substrate-binding protein
LSKRVDLISGFVTRRAAIKIMSVGAASGALSDKGFSQQLRIIRFGLTPVFLTNDLEVLNALQTYLQVQTGYTVELVSRRTYQEVTSLLVSGQLDAAWICGFPFIQYKNNLSLIAVPEWNNKPLYQAYLIVAGDRKVDSWRGIEGDIHAFSDPNSNSGYLVTRALLNENGLDLATFFRKTMFTYGHRNVIRAVASGLAQSGSVDGYVWEVMKAIEPQLVDRTKVIRKSEWLGFPPIATSRQNADSAAIAALRTALLVMKDHESGRKVLEMLRLTGFVKAGPELYDSIGAKVASLNGLL